MKRIIWTIGILLAITLLGIAIYYETEKTKITFIIMIISEILFVLPMWLPFIFKILNIGKLKEDYQKSDADIICTYRAYGWGLVMILWFMLIVSMVMATIFVGIGFLFLVFMSFAAAIYWFLMYKNFLFIIHSEGIIFRNFRNQTFQYKRDEIQYYHIVQSSKSRSIVIETTTKSIAMNNYCTNFYKAEEWLAKNVRCSNMA